MKNLYVAIISLFMALAPHPSFSAIDKTVDDFRAAADKAKAVLTIPEWEQLHKRSTTP